MTSQCPQCSSDAVTLYMGGQFGKYECKQCGYVGPMILTKEGSLRVVVIGGGFAGLRAAYILRKGLGGSADVTVVDKRSHQEFTPGLFQNLGSKIGKRLLEIPFKSRLSSKDISFVKEEVTSVDTDKREISMNTQKLEYDYLLLAVGNEPSVLESPVRRFHTLDDAMSLRKLLHSRHGESHIVIIGGGLTGVELAGTLAEMNHRKKWNITLVERSTHILRELPRSAGKKAEEYLVSQGVRIRTGCAIERITAKQVKLSDGVIRSDVVISATGMKPSSIVSRVSVESGFSGLIVDQYLQTSKLRVFGAGNCIAFRDPHIEVDFKRRAQTAVTLGTLAAENIIRRIRQQPLKEVKFDRIPTLVYLGGTTMLSYGDLAIKGKVVTALGSAVRWKHRLGMR